MSGLVEENDPSNTESDEFTDSEADSFLDCMTEEQRVGNSFLFLCLLFGDVSVSNPLL